MKRVSLTKGRQPVKFKPVFGRPLEVRAVPEFLGSQIVWSTDSPIVTLRSARSPGLSASFSFRNGA